MSDGFIDSLLPGLGELEALFDRLWPICRSITGHGFRQSLDILRELVPFEPISVSSGTKVLDWVVPDEWNIEEAFLDREDGTRVLDFKQSNLHVVSYSIPVDQWLTLEELDSHLHSRPDLPEAIPYLTSYYKRHWGFCLSHRQRQALKPGRYHAVIRSSLRQGRLVYGDYTLESGARAAKTVLLSTYLCHPSLANNELSGPIVTAFLGRALAKIPRRRYDYRLVVVPETIGSIAFLAKNGVSLKKSCAAGLVINCCGSAHPFTYKRSRRGADIDRIVEHVLKSEGVAHKVLDFFPTGSDERQYCSPGYDLPIGSLMRAMYGDYPEYHTSLDDKSFISFDALRETIRTHLKVLLSFEENRRLRNTVRRGEPQLGSRGLYPTLGSQPQPEVAVNRMLWLINYSDGRHDLCDIAQKASCSILDLAELSHTLLEKQLLVEA